VVEPAVAEGDARTSTRPESLLHLGASIAVGISKRADPDVFGLDVDVSVGGYGQEAQGTEIVRVDEGAEPRRKLDGAVVRVGSGERGAEGGGEGQGGKSKEQSFHVVSRRWGRAPLYPLLRLRVSRVLDCASTKLERRSP
jgi:hypothetical protein